MAKTISLEVPDELKTFSIDEASAIADCSRGSIYKALREGSLKSVMLLGRRRIPLSEIRRLMEPVPYEARDWASAKPGARRGARS